MPSIHYFQNSENLRLKFSYKTVLFGVISSVILSALLIFIGAFVLLYTNISQQVIPFISKAIMLFSVFAGGVVSGLKSKVNGWLYGALTGICFFSLLFALGIVIGANSHNSFILIILGICCVVIGSIGGVLGINLKPKSKSRAKH